MKKFFLICVAMSAIGPNAAGAADYAPGFVWDRSNDWSLGPTVGSTAGNPDGDKKGSPVWRYEYTSGGDLESANPWYLQPKTLMVWDRWDPVGPAPENLWVRADNLEPKINQYTLSNSRSERWESWEYQSLVRWINPVGDGALIDISGNFAVEWGGWGVSPEVGVDVILAFKDESENSVSLLYADTLQNPKANQPNPPFPRVTVPIAFDDLRFDEGDSLLISLRARTAPSPEDSWIVMYDDVKLTYVASVPEPGQWALMGLGLLAVGAVARTVRKTRVQG